MEHIFHGAYTNIGTLQTFKLTITIAYLLDYDVNENWVHVMENMKLSMAPNSNITLEYYGMTNDIIVKQADVILISYLDDQDQFSPDIFGYDRQRAINDLIYHAQKLNDVGCGFMTYLKKSYEPSIRFPCIQMSEQNNDNFNVNGGTHPAFLFNTGHADVIREFYYRLLGIRYSYLMNDGFKRVLHIEPVKLPLFNGDFKMNGFKYMNQSIDIAVNDTYVNSKKHGGVPVGISITEVKWVVDIMN